MNNEKQPIIIKKKIIITVDDLKTGIEARKFRKFHELSLRKVAKEMGLSATMLSDLERGNRRWSENKVKRFIQAINSLSEIVPIPIVESTEEGKEISEKIKKKKEPKAYCYDCGLEYGGIGWIEAIIPDKIWVKISPNGDDSGILCINCISRRLQERGYQNIPIWLRGTEPIYAVHGDFGDDINLFVLRNWDTMPTNKIKE